MTTGGDDDWTHGSDDDGIVMATILYVSMCSVRARVEGKLMDGTNRGDDCGDNERSNSPVATTTA